MELISISKELSQERLRYNTQHYHVQQFMIKQVCIVQQP